MNRVVSPAPFGAEDWAPFLTAEVQTASGRIPGGAVERDLGMEDVLLLEIALRILGESGHETALPVVKAIQDRLAGADREKAYGAWQLHCEADRTRTKRETIAELAERYPGRAQDRIRALLRHANPEVAADAALVVLKNQPADPEALDLLDRVAGDAATEIPPDVNWFGAFARKAALEYLRSDTAPAGARWDAGRVRRQLALPDEDGRMVHALLDALAILGTPAADAEKFEAYRRVLAGPRNKGVLVACEELIKSRDRVSVSAIRGLLDELQAGCNKQLSWQADRGARYSWVDRCELERIRQSIEDLDKP
jgi:hypothetical protein